MNPAPIMSCPDCGERLVRAHRPGRDTAPWISPSCSRGFWPQELTAAARLAERNRRG